MGWHSDKEERRRWREASGRSGRRRWEGELLSPKRVDNNGLGMIKRLVQKEVPGYVYLFVNHDYALKMGENKLGHHSFTVRRGLQLL